MKQDDDHVPFIFRVLFFPFQLIFIILFIVFTILTFGVFLKEDDKIRKPKKKRKDVSLEERLQLDLQRKQHEIDRVRDRILALESTVTLIKRNERRIFFRVRLTIVLLIIGGNAAFIAVRDVPSEPKLSEAQYYRDLISDVTDFNALILLLYTLPAFLLYGTVSRFTGAMKSKTVSILRRKHIPTFSELQQMKQTEKQLVSDIHYLQMRLREFG